VEEIKDVLMIHNNVDVASVLIHTLLTNGRGGLRHEHTT
jgi:hypothetical protein